MPYKIRLLGVGGGISDEEVRRWVPSYVAGGFIASFDIELGMESLEVTLDEEKALLFDSAKDALEFWQQVDPLEPRRPDGEPNKPLTAFTIEIDRLG